MDGSEEQFPPGHQPGRRRREQKTKKLRSLATILALALAVVLLLTGWDTPAAALSLPRFRGGAPASAPSPDRSLSLQEVSPPEPVRQLQNALASRQPVLEILSPAEDAVLGAGPWLLKLRVHDWPLVDGGSLGPGPHLVVQIDQEPSQIWTTTEGLMPELSPGSHRLTVYAALPWGEARKDPGAARQIRLHRTAINPLAVPEPGSPQLLAVSPPERAGDEPLLLDWLLLNAPLQNVGGSGVQWRLRVDINGEALLLEQPTALWLRGWKAGVNALKLEVLDGRGAPLNPPFNSLVREVDRSAPAPSSRWVGGALSTQELAVLLGQSPASPAPQMETLPQEPAAAAQAASEGAGGADTAATPERLPGPEASGDPPIAADATATHSPSASAMDPGESLPELPERQPDTPMTTPAEHGDDSADAPAQPPSDASAAAGAPLAPPHDIPEAIDTAPSPNPDTEDDPQMPAAAFAADHGSDPATSDGEGDHSARAAARDDALTEAAPPPEPTAETAPPQSGGSEEDSREADDDDEATATDSATGIATLVSDQDDLAPYSPPAAAAINASPAPEPPPVRPPLTGEDDDPALPLQDPLNGPAPDPSASTATAPAPVPTAANAAAAAGSDRIQPSTRLEGRARDLVQEDGTLKRPQARGPLAALRDRWQP